VHAQVHKTNAWGELTPNSGNLVLARRRFT